MSEIDGVMDVVEAAQLVEQGELSVDTMIGFLKVDCGLTSDYYYEQVKNAPATLAFICRAKGLGWE